MSKHTSLHYFLQSFGRKKSLCSSPNPKQKSRNTKFKNQFGWSVSSSARFFGRLPKQIASFLAMTSLAIFQKNEHSLVAIEPIKNNPSVLRLRSG
jgi:hypothetical protein